MGTSQAIKAYNSLAAVISTLPTDRKKERESNMMRFSEAFEKILVDSGHNVDTPIRASAGGNGNCKVSVRLNFRRHIQSNSFTSAVCVLNSLDTVSCQFIRSYPTRGMSTPNCSILKAACATVASPETYEPVDIGEEDAKMGYIDAMAGYANPTSEIFKEAEKVFGKNALVATLISVGSGKVEPRQWKPDASGKKLSDILKRAITDTERVHNSIQSRFQDLGIYFRFNVEHAPPLEDSIGKTIRVQTVAYLEDEGTSQRMDGALTSIRERRGVKPLRELSIVPSFE
jgi:hypothetical protein